MSQVVIGDILPRTQATATGSQTVFSTNWTANAASDVVVYKTPVGNAPNDFLQILSYPSQYSVAFIGAEQEVQVTLVSGATAGDIITITRQTPADRMNLYTNTNFTPTMLNNDFGILTLVDQQAQLVNQLIGPRYNYSAKIIDIVDTILPLLVANQGWVKDSDNDEIIAYTFPSAGSGIAPADATYILQTSNSSLPNSQALSTLGANSILAWNNGTHQIISTSIAGTANQIGVTNGDGSGTIVISISNNPIFGGTAGMGIPAGTTGQRVIPTPPNINLRYNSTLDSLEFYSTGAWHLISDDSDGIILPGLTNQIPYYAADGNTLSPTSTLPTAVQDNITRLGTIASIGAPLGAAFGGTGVISPTAHGVMIGEGASAMASVVLAAGQVLVGTTASDPAAASISSGTGITVGLSSGAISIALAPIATLTGLVNTTGGSAAPTATTLSAWIDAALGSVQGDILYRNASGWVVLPPGTSGQQLTTGGAGANVSWTASSAGGTVTSVATNNGLTGGTITTTGTLGLASIADHTLLANISGGSTFPSSTTLTALIDNAIGSTQGNILYRNASTWVALAPGTSGQYLQTQGAAANPIWAPGDGAGTVTSVATNNGLTGGTITSSGTIGLASIATLTGLVNTTGGSTFPSSTTLTAWIDAALGSTQGNILYRNASAWVVLAPGTNGQVFTTGGAAANPSWTTNGAGTVTSVSVVTANGFSGSVATSTSTPAITLNASTASCQIALTGAVSNVTGDATAYTIIYNNVVYDPGSMCNTSTGVITVPTTGIYNISLVTSVTGLGAAHTQGQVFLSGTGNLDYGNYFVQSSSAILIRSASINVYLNASSSFSIVLTVAGGTKTVGIGTATQISCALIR